MIWDAILHKILHVPNDHFQSLDIWSKGSSSDAIQRVLRDTKILTLYAGVSWQGFQRPGAHLQMSLVLMHQRTPAREKDREWVRQTEELVATKEHNWQKLHQVCKWRSHKVLNMHDLAQNIQRCEKQHSTLLQINASLFIVSSRSIPGPLP